MTDMRDKEPTQAQDAGGAGGRTQPDSNRSNANESDGEDGGASRPGTASKVDLGQGSHEQTQGGDR